MKAGFSTYKEATGIGHYFQNNPPKQLRNYTVTFTVRQQPFSLLARSGVFSKRTLDTGTAILIDVLLDENITGKVLDLGCGYGPVGLTLARFNPHLELTLADINEQAVQDAQHNANSLGFTTLRIVVSNGFQELTQNFDVIAFNPPIRAGKKAIYDLYHQTKQHLTQAGRLYIVIRKDKGAITHRAYLETLFSEVQLLRRDQGYHVLVAKH